ncbi:MAG TPA: cytochrome c [Methylomirabilota bacterium]|nr:cytochrome c [Methylomirabilota bacterium]
MRYLVSILIAVIVLSTALFAVLGLPGRISRKPPLEVFSDMDRQLKLRPQKPNGFFANGVSSQLPPAGTIARGTPIQTINGAVYLFEDSPVNSGKISGTTNFIETNPLRVDAQLLARGRERFDIYCAPCHGKLGDGNGIIKTIGAMPAVANLHDKRIVEMTDGEIFNTITHGKNTMGAYGPLVSTGDRWAIISYLRALQLSRLGTVDDLPPAQRAAFK